MKVGFSPPLAARKDIARHRWRLERTLLATVGGSKGHCSPPLAARKDWDVLM
jgi:hypothetical protein